MGNDKPNQLTSIFHNQSDCVPVCSKSAHGSAIKSKLLRKTSLVQTKDRLKIITSIPTKKGRTIHAGLYSVKPRQHRIANPNKGVPRWRSQRGAQRIVSN